MMSEQAVDSSGDEPGVDAKTQGRTISEARLRANRANAMHSTGPRTDSGKNKSRANAFTDGLTATQVLIVQVEGERAAAEFSAMLSDLEASYKPGTPLESRLVQQIAEHMWRLQRVRDFEFGAVAESVEAAMDEWESSQLLQPRSRSEQEVAAYEQGLSDLDGEDPFFALATTESFDRRNAMGEMLYDRSPALAKRVGILARNPRDLTPEKVDELVAEVCLRLRRTRVELLEILRAEFTRRREDVATRLSSADNPPQSLALLAGLPDDLREAKITRQERHQTKLIGELERRLQRLQYLRT